MFCPQCGKKNDGPGRYCAYCGGPLPVIDSSGSEGKLKEHRTGPWQESSRRGFTGGKVRSFWGLVGLSIITVGIYFYYWYYINIKEMKEAVGPGNSGVMDRARLFYYAVLGMSIVTTLAVASSIPDILSDLDNAGMILSDARRSTGQTAVNFISTSVYIAFLYYYTKSVSLAQSKAGLPSLNMKNLMIQAVSGAVLGFLGSSMDMAGLAGGILMLVYIYSIQNEINRIWREGKV